MDLWDQSGMIQFLAIHKYLNRMKEFQAGLSRAKCDFHRKQHQSTLRYFHLEY